VIGHHLQRLHAKKRGGDARPRQVEEAEIPQPGDDEDFDREWVLHLIENGLCRLAADHPHYHGALRAFLMQEKSYAEIARDLGKTEGDVKNYVFRGKRKLIEYLRERVREYSASAGEYEGELRHLARYFPQ